MSKTVILLARPVGQREGTGVDTYTELIIRGLEKASIKVVVPADSNNKLIKFLRLAPRRKSAIGLIVHDVIIPVAFCLFGLRTLRGKIIHVVEDTQGAVLPLLRIVSKNIVTTIYDLGPFTKQSLRYTGKFSDLIYTMFFIFATRLAVTCSSELIAVSSQTREEIINAFRVFDKVHVVNFGVPLGNCATPRSIISKQQFTIGSAGALIARKRFHMTLECLSLIREKISYKDVFVLLAGNGPMKDELLQACKKLNIYESVRFIGHLNSRGMQLFYNKIDVLFHPSIYEGFGYPILEAISNGVPVITLEDASIPQEIKSCTIVVKDSRHAADTIIEMISSPDYYEMLSSRALRYAKYFDLDSMIKRVVDIYDRL